jgi:hypothetical protein
MSQLFKSPSQPLAGFVDRLWCSSDSPQHQKVRVVPSGTMELVFNLGEDELDFSDTEQLIIHFATPATDRSLSRARQEDSTQREQRR